MNNTETVVCTLETYSKLIERMIELERELAKIRHQKEIDELNERIADLENRNTKLFVENFNLKRELSGHEAETV